MKTAMPRTPALTRTLVEDLNASREIEVAAVISSPAEGFELMRRGFARHLRRAR